MNRRRLLTMLPLLPAAALLPAPTTEAAPLDTRPVYRRSEYVIARYTGNGECWDCHEVHQYRYWASNHHKVAFRLTETALHLAPETPLEPVTDDAIPEGVARAVDGCPVNPYGNASPHTHDGLFRWVD